MKVAEFRPGVLASARRAVAKEHYRDALDGSREDDTFESLLASAYGRYRSAVSDQTAYGEAMAAIDLIALVMERVALRCVDRQYCDGLLVGDASSFDAIEAEEEIEAVSR